MSKKNYGKSKNNYSNKKGGRASADFNEKGVQKDSYKCNALSQIGKPNDFEWYNRVPGLIDESVGFNWYYPLGRNINLMGQNYAEPFMMVLNTITTPGYSEDVNGPASVASIALYQYIRSKLNKPTSSYVAGDSGVVMFCFADLVATYNDLVRLFGLTRIWDKDNYYMPRTILKALYGMSAQEFERFSEVSANYRERFKLLIDRAAYFFIPNDFAIIQRYMWEFSNVFKDHDTAKAQYFAYRKAGYWVLDETVSEQGTAAVFKPYVHIADTEIDAVEYRLNCFQEQIEALRNSDVMNAVQSDMRQAFQDATGFNFSYVDEDFRLEIKRPVDNVLSQIENTMFYDVMRLDQSTEEPTWNNSLIFTQDVNTDTLRFAPYIPDDGTANVKTFREYLASSDVLLNLHWDNPEKGDIVEAMRNMWTVIPDLDESDNPIFKFRMGPDFVNDVSLIGNMDGLFQNFNLKTQYAGYRLNDFSLWLQYWSRIDWAPRFYYSASASDGKFLSCMETDNYTLVDPNSIDRLNVVCLNSLWSFPQFGYMAR